MTDTSTPSKDWDLKNWLEAIDASQADLSKLAKLQKISGFSEPSFTKFSASGVPKEKLVDLLILFRMHLATRKLPLFDPDHVRDHICIFFASKVTREPSDLSDAQVDLIIKLVEFPVAPLSSGKSAPKYKTRLILTGAAGIFLVVVLLGMYFIQGTSQTIVNNHDWTPQFMTKSGYQLALVPAGCFNMGNSSGREDEKPVHQQCFTKPYWIGVTEVTNEQYGSPPEDACNTNQITMKGFVNGKEPNYPRNCVTWKEANTFCQTHDMRLPTEAEWEYAARGVDNWLYPWGNGENMNYAIVRTNFSNNGAIPGDMQPVGSKPYDTSWVGAKDMAGSLREFTSTIYDTVTVNGVAKFPYPYNAADGRESLENTGTSADKVNRAQLATIRVVRGGSFDFDISKATATIRNNEWFDFLWNDYGFRCALDAN
jgi:formylglycine-generating enzyme required for sulfatase activity